MGPSKMITIMAVPALEKSKGKRHLHDTVARRRADQAIVLGREKNTLDRRSYLVRWNSAAKRISRVIISKGPRVGRGSGQGADYDLGTASKTGDPVGISDHSPSQPVRRLALSCGHSPDLPHLAKALCNAHRILGMLRLLHAACMT